MHLNLAGCALNLGMFENILEGMKTSMTLVSLNLSCNPFLERDFMFEIPKEKMLFTMRKQSDFVEPANILKTHNSAEVAMLSKENRIR